MEGGKNECLFALTCQPLVPHLTPSVPEPTSYPPPKPLSLLVKMKVKVELLLTRTVTLDIVDSDLDDPGHFLHPIQTPNPENLHSLKIVEVNGRQVGTSLDPGNALEVSNDQKMVKLRQIIPAMLQELRKKWNSQSVIPSNG